MAYDITNIGRTLRTYNQALQLAIFMHGSKWTAYITIVQRSDGTYCLRPVPLL